MNNISPTTVSGAEQQATAGRWRLHYVVPIGLILAAHVALLAWGAMWHSPTTVEMSSMATGVYHWHSGKFDAFRVNPPLVRLVATAPVVLSEPATDWKELRKPGNDRPEFALGSDFVRANGQRSFWLFTLARWACIPFSLVGAMACYCWARELYGVAAGMCALCLWCFAPDILGHGQLIAADASAAALGVLAGYMFWRWLRRPDWPRAIVAGLALGLAELTKATWIVLFGLWPLLWAAWALTGSSRVSRPMVFRQIVQMATILVLGVGVLNFGYTCQGSFERLGNFAFVSRTLGGEASATAHTDAASNRFSKSWLGRIPVPLPKDYVLGIDLQKRDFEGGQYCYLGGFWQSPGWWYYYLYALAVKIPVGISVLVLLAVSVSFSRQWCSASWRDAVILLVPAAAVLLLVSSQQGMSIHSRYVLPVLPFLLIWASKAARAFEIRPLSQQRLAVCIVVVVALTWSVGSSLWAYPHSLSYFNELAGGPRHGGEYLLDSNIDWGQDLLYLKQWLDRHPEVKFSGLASGWADLATFVGIPKAPSPPQDPGANGPGAGDSGRPVGPRPGWYALSVNHLYDHTGCYCYFLRFEPVASAGYSIYIYHITQDEANRVRKELGLPELGKETAAGIAARNCKLSGTKVSEP